METQAELEKRVLLFVPTPRDAELTHSLLTRAGLSCSVCISLELLSTQIDGGAGAIVLTEEAIADDRIELLLAALDRQPAWSDVPVVMLMRGGVQSPVAARVLAALGNVMLLERPAPMRSVLSAVQAAVRSRQRQYQIRDQIDFIDRTRKELAASEEREHDARVEAERISGMKDEFLATLSHELRTPLNAIFGWTQLIKRARNDPETVDQGIEIIDRNVRVQTQLIEDLLDMSRIISGKVRLDVEPIDLHAVIAAAVDGVRPAADAKQIRLESSIDPRLESLSGDAGRLQQILWNLLTNAIKFTPSGGIVRLKAHQADGSAQISVSDTGEGISPAFLPHLFERFSQADGSAKRKHGGLGLGLSIVKNLVEMHGGTVQATSAGEGKGATFIVEIPVRVPRTEEGNARLARDVPKTIPEQFENGRLRGVKVLVVDDEPDARELLRRLLVAGEAEPELAASAAEARTILASFKPDVILSDIAMPQQDGYEFIREIRRQGVTTPAVALTAFARAEDRLRSIQAGYQTHLPKPVEAAELLAVVASLCGRFDKKRREGI